MKKHTVITIISLALVLSFSNIKAKNGKLEYFITFLKPDKLYSAWIVTNNNLIYKCFSEAKNYKCLRFVDKNNKLPTDPTKAPTIFELDGDGGIWVGYVDRRLFHCRSFTSGCMEITGQ